MSENFPTFGEAVQRRYGAMAEQELFVVDIGDIYASYLAAFPDGSNPIFRERTEHDCSTCKSFIRVLGRVVTIASDGSVGTVWDDCADLPHPYSVVAERMAAIVRQAPIVAVFRTKERQYGAGYNYDSATDRRWNHFVGRVADRHYSTSPDEARGAIATAAQTMRRGLDEIRPDDLAAVLDLIDQNGLYRGEEKRAAIVAFQATQRDYQAAANRDLFVWAIASTPAGQHIGRFRNDVIGTLLVDLASGVELERAVRSYEAKVAPTNYRRPTAIITPKMVEAALATLRAEGLESAVERRFARISDVSVNNVLFVDNSVRSEMRDGLAGLLMEEARPQTVDVKHAERISAADFFANIVPQAQTVEVLVENKHLSNFVSLTAPVDADTGRLFRWGNDFAWSYDGEVADSIKQRVKAAGGNIDAALRVSLAWTNFDDLDIHCHCPEGHVFFHNKMGILDVDMNAGGGHTREPVENLAWVRPRDGQYRISVHNYAKRETTNVGFSLELECGGRLEQYVHAQAVPDQATVKCLSFTMAGGALTALTVDSPALVGGSVSVQKWGVTTQTLVAVNTIMLSPNHWDDQAVGNRHYFFMLRGCLSPDPARGLYNEFLRPELERHRKVFEVLAAKTKCPPTADQLSGVGFSAGRGDTVVVVVKGKRINKAYEVAF